MHQCKIVKIIPSRIFVKIEKINRSGSIYIGELDDKYIIDIYKFKYEGNAIYVGQNLKAKIIEINEKGISLSLRL
jgi:predicted RNA-binding protein with RPS1 domain